MKFADFKPNMIIHHPPVVVQQTDMLDFARQYDPQWFHTDPARAQAGRWQGLIGSGFMTCALAMRMAVDAALHDSEAFGSPGIENVKWLTPVRPNDALRLEATVLSARRSRSKPDLGVLNWTWRLFNQHEEPVLELTVTSLFDLVGPPSA